MLSYMRYFLSIKEVWMKDFWYFKVKKFNTQHRKKKNEFLKLPAKSVVQV